MKHWDTLHLHALVKYFVQTSLLLTVNVWSFYFGEF